MNGLLSQGKLSNGKLSGASGGATFEDYELGEGILKSDFAMLKEDLKAYLLGSTSFKGTHTVFESATTVFISVTTLTSTKALVCYQDNSNSSHGTACVLDVSGGTITAGTPVVFESAEVQGVSVTTLTSTKALVCYMDDGNSNYGTACVLDVSGSTITAGTPVVFESAATDFTSVTTLTSTKALVCYRDNGNSSYGTACILDVSGSTITAGTPVVFESAYMPYISVTTLTSTKALVCYQDYSDSYRGTVCVLDVSGSTITAGTPVVFESAITKYISVTTLTSTKALVCYQDNSNSYRGTACILDVSGSTITAGTPVVFENSDARDISVTTLSSTKALVCYQDYDLNYGVSCVLNIYGSTAVAKEKIVFESSALVYISVTTLSSTKALVCYKNYSSPYYGVSCVLDMTLTKLLQATEGGAVGETKKFKVFDLIEEE